LDAVEHESYPVSANARAICGGTEKSGKLENGPSAGASGVSRWQMARSADDIAGLTEASSGPKSYP
jgi:hypothetical protein